ncbi:MAG: uncharacterized protein QOG15_2208 [Solirubrobacteraceae bacterium]|nr:uncharacterized protein [Solirubrobacteraceae bacterium]
MTVALAAAAVFLGASLQSATGFGFALIAAPVLFAAFGPREAVTASVLVGIEVSALTLVTERRMPRVLTGEALALVAWSLPGLALGALALRELPDRLLSVLVAVGVLGGLVLRVRARRARRTSRLRWWSRPAAGIGSGALSTSTSLSGPPLILYLLARGVTAGQMRDTLAAVFVALSVLSVPALLATGTFDVPPAPAALFAAGAAGQLLGRRIFAHLAGERYENVVLAVLAVAALVALATSVV